MCVHSCKIIMWSGLISSWLYKCADELLFGFMYCMHTCGCLCYMLCFIAVKNNKLVLPVAEKKVLVEEG